MTMHPITVPAGVVCGFVCVVFRVCRVLFGRATSPHNVPSDDAGRVPYHVRCLQFELVGLCVPPARMRRK